MEVDVKRAFLARLGIEAVNSGACIGSWIETTGEPVVSLNPTDAEPIGSVRRASVEDYERVVQALKKFGDVLRSAYPGRKSQHRQSCCQHPHPF